MEGGRGWRRERGERESSSAVLSLDVVIAVVVAFFLYSEITGIIVSFLAGQKKTNLADWVIFLFLS